MNFTVAIDGPAASGKSSTAELVAKRLNFERVDSGMFYRAITYLVYRSLGDFSSSSPETQEFVSSLNLRQAGGKIFCGEEDITDKLRTQFVDSRVGIVAKELFVRNKAREAQYNAIHSILGGCMDGVVVDGRDIGTVVLPNAFLKVFITAKDTVRAERRALQTGQDYDEVLKDIRTRDRLDIIREYGPLKLAEDAFLVENDGMNLDCTVDKIVEQFLQKAALLSSNKHE